MSLPRFDTPTPPTPHLLLSTQWSPSPGVCPSCPAPALHPSQQFIAPAGATLFCPRPAESRWRRAAPPHAAQQPFQALLWRQPLRRHAELLRG